MASTASAKGQTEEFSDVTGNDDGWEDVSTESQIVFDTIGDEFIGTFTGWSETPGGIPQAHFRNADGEFFTNCGWDLKQKLSKCKTGKLTRIRLTGFQDIPGRDTRMMLFQVGQKSA